MVERAFAVAVLVVVAGCTGFPAGSDPGTTTATPQPTTTPEPTTDTTAQSATQATALDRPRVTIEDESGEELGAVTVELAETSGERYTGLSEHDSLGPNEGMLFVYDDEAMRTFVMRSMSFPIDIVFVGADGRITQIHHAPVEDDNEDLTGYGGVGQWVLEVPYNWTTERGVEVGDRIHIER
jgi:uncharacterized membrane protein (UPF0127 family)